MSQNVPALCLGTAFIDVRLSPLKIILVDEGVIRHRRGDRCVRGGLDRWESSGLHLRFKPGFLVVWKVQVHVLMIQPFNRIFQLAALALEAKAATSCPL